MGNFCNCFPKDDAPEINVEEKKLLKKKEIYTKNFENLDLNSQVQETKDEDDEGGEPIKQESKKKNEEVVEEKNETEQNKENVISADFLNNTTLVEVLGGGHEGVNGEFRWHALTSNFMRLTESGSSYTIENKNNINDEFLAIKNLNSTWVITEIGREMKDGNILYYFNKNAWEAMDKSNLPVPKVQEGLHKDDEEESESVSELEMADEDMSDLSDLSDQEEDCNGNPKETGI